MRLRVTARACRFVRVVCVFARDRANARICVYLCACTFAFACACVIACVFARVRMRVRACVGMSAGVRDRMSKLLLELERTNATPLICHVCACVRARSGVRTRVRVLCVRACVRVGVR